MPEKKIYQTKPLGCWNKAKELQRKYFQDYLAADGGAGLRVSGGTLAMSSITAGLGDDVFPLAMEPYSAMIGASGQFNVECLEAAERFGFAPDMCAYTKNYWGSILLDKYLGGGKFPKPNFRWQTHICCTHAKSDTVAAHLEGGVPTYIIDVAVGYYQPHREHKVRYLVDQMHDGIAWMEKITGRTYDDEKLIRGVLNEIRAASLWGKICSMNKRVPAVLDEKTMYPLQAIHTLIRHKDEGVAFYRELRDEVQDRFDQGISALPVEKCRLISTNQPPWPLLKIFRYFEEFGALSVGSLYTYALTTPWEVDEQGSMTPVLMPEESGLELKTREDALLALADLNMKIPTFYLFHDIPFRSRMELQLVRDWHVNGVVMHLNRGCEAGCMGILETRK
ncbi:MAG: 2-hydroxyacyl-CoA dehydratase, partial [Pseudomonadota bacterium]